jgi:hypothetical protein
MASNWRRSSAATSRLRTDDIAAFKIRLDVKGISYSDYGGWAMTGWQQIFFYDPDANVIEVHQAPAGAAPRLSRGASRYFRLR